MLLRIKKLYNRSTITQKQDLVSSIFPEKLQFDGKKCRTPRINDTLRYILQIDRDLQGNKKGQFSKKLHLSHKVEPKGQISNTFRSDLKRLIRFIYKFKP